MARRMKRLNASSQTSRGAWLLGPLRAHDVRRDEKAGGRPGRTSPCGSAGRAGGPATERGAAVLRELAARHLISGSCEGRRCLNSALQTRTPRHREENDLPEKSHLGNSGVGTVAGSGRGPA